MKFDMKKMTLDKPEWVNADNPFDAKFNDFYALLRNDYRLTSITFILDHTLYQIRKQI